MHNYCACPWCQGPRPLPRKVSENELEQARKDYERLLAQLPTKPPAPYKSEWATMNPTKI